MSFARPRANVFSAERLFAPRSVLLLGHETAEGSRILRNLTSSDYAGELFTIADDTGNLTRAYPSIAALPKAPDLAILAGSPAQAGPWMRDLSRLGTRAGIAITPLPEASALVAETDVRMMGPSSFGLAIPSIGLNASVSHMAPPAGRIALISQSASLARTVIDWAGPNGVGFSHVIGTGTNADLGFGVALDWLSRDPGTGLILLDIRRVRLRRAFISAARAASRLRPVVAIRPGGRLLDPTGRADDVFAAALNRAGVFVVRHLDEFLAAAETLTRARPLRAEGLAIVTHAIGPGRLAADAALEAGITLASLPEDAQTALRATLPADVMHGLFYIGSAAPTHVAELAAMVSAVPDVGGVLVLLAPTGPQDTIAAEAVIAAASITRLPILTCIMGETTGAALRRRLAEAGLPVFATPEQAVGGFFHLLRDRQARIAAAELPGRQVVEVTPDTDEAHRIIAAAREAGREALTKDESVGLLAAYGITCGAGTPPGVARHAALRVHDDPMFGPAIGLACPPGNRPVYDLPPLNLALARALARRAGLVGAEAEAAASLLVRVSELLIGERDISMLGLDPLLIPSVGHACALDAAIWLRPAGQQAELSIRPYPEHLTGHYSARGQDFLIRPIRPEDAEAHAAMVSRVPPEDARFRFFTAVRNIAPEQMARLTQIDYDREMAFIAARTDGATVGVSRLVRVGDSRGEFAVLVEPSAKGLGLATHLMQRLIAWARDEGITEIVGTILSENHTMLEFARHLGFTLHRVPDEPDVVEAVLPLGS